VHRRKIAALIILPMVAACIAWMFSIMMTPVYRATTTLMVTTTSLSANGAAPSLNTITASRLFPKIYAEIAGSQQSLDELSARLEHTFTPEQLRSMIKVIPVKDLELMQINVEDIDPERAAFIANSLVEVLRQQEKVLWGTDYLRVVHSAYPPPALVKPRVRANIVAAGSSGFILAALWLLYSESRKYRSS
jgi:capsular polysaccharide biosynthesis protein